MHRAKANLGKHPKLNVLQLPFTFTWDTDHLYVTRRAAKLSVLRIALFRATTSCASTSTESYIYELKNPIHLPDTAARRSVYFTPTGDSTYTVIMGSESRRTNDVLTSTTPGMRGMLSPPIGCFLREEQLGGWVRSEDDIAIPKRQGVGKLGRRMGIYFIEGFYGERQWLMIVSMVATSPANTCLSS